MTWAVFSQSLLMLVRHGNLADRTIFSEVWDQGVVGFPSADGRAAEKAQSAVTVLLVEIDKGERGYITRKGERRGGT